jgi:hypothetical protein
VTKILKYKDNDYLNNYYMIKEKIELIVSISELNSDSDSNSNYEKKQNKQNKQINLYTNLFK